MYKLELYLDEYENKTLSDDIYDEYLKFGYNDEQLYKLHLDFMLNNLYNIKLTKSARARLNQTEFRKEILKKFNYACIISGETCQDELTAAHIIPISDNENYDVDNGLLLRENLHKTFDNYKWSINPETLIVEIKLGVNVGQIKEFVGKQLNLGHNTNMKKNLIEHYKKFKNDV